MRSRPVRLWEESGKCCGFPAVKEIPVTVVSLNQPAVLVADTLDDALGGLNVEASRFAHGDSSGVHAGLLARGDGGHDQIAGLEPSDGLFAHQIASGKAISVQPGALIAAASRRFEREGRALPNPHDLALCHGADL